jgi:hypothetical protein
VNIFVSLQAVEQSRRYDGLSSQCRAVAGPTDLAHFVRSLPTPQHNPHHPSLRHNFVAPLPPPPPETPEGTGGASGEPLANVSAALIFNKLSTCVHVALMYRTDHSLTSFLNLMLFVLCNVLAVIHIHQLMHITHFKVVSKFVPSYIFRQYVAIFKDLNTKEYFNCCLSVHVDNYTIIFQQNTLVFYY